MLLVLIESDAGKIESDFAFSGYLGASKENWLHNDKYRIEMATESNISAKICYARGSRNYLGEELRVLPIGYISFMKRAFEFFKINIPEPINIPDSLIPYCGRKVWVSDFDDIKFPCFVKTLNK